MLLKICAGVCLMYVWSEDLELMLEDSVAFFCLPHNFWICSFLEYTQVVNQDWLQLVTPSCVVALMLYRFCKLVYPVLSLPRLRISHFLNAFWNLRWWQSFYSHSGTGRQYTKRRVAGIFLMAILKIIKLMPYYLTFLPIRVGWKET